MSGTVAKYSRLHRVLPMIDLLLEGKNINQTTKALGLKARHINIKGFNYQDLIKMNPEEKVVYLNKIKADLLEGCPPQLLKAIEARQPFYKFIAEEAYHKIMNENKTYQEAADEMGVKMVTARKAYLWMKTKVRNQMHTKHLP